MKTKEKILETLLKIQELVESIADNQHRPNAVFYKPYSLPIPNWNNDNEEKPQGLPESWCIDIRVDDPRVEGFKEWFNKETNFDWYYDDYNDYWGISEEFESGPMYENEIPRMTILTLDKFEELSGVNLMDYTNKQEVKIEPDEQPKKLYTKEEILEQYEKYNTEDDFLQTFSDWIRQNM